MFKPGIDIRATFSPLGYEYGKGVYGPKPETRHLDDIRKSLMDPDCEGPNDLYAIVMDIGNELHREDMLERDLLFASCVYNYGQMGQEPIRSQGHIHAKSLSCNSSTCELYEIWEGEAIIYMQEYVQDYPGRCFAIRAKQGEVVIVPPFWGHQTVNANLDKPMVFGAWCVRDYGFDYDDVRAHKGLAYYPVVKDKEIIWHKNPHYLDSTLVERSPRIYTEFGIDPTKPIYQQFVQDPDRMLFVSKPATAADLWLNFEP